MKKKIGTIINEELVFKAKQVALSKNCSLSQLFEDALKMYFLAMESEKRERQKNIAKRTQGVMKVSPPILKAIMGEEGFYEAN